MKFEDLAPLMLRRNPAATCLLPERGAMLNSCDFKSLTAWRFSPDTDCTEALSSLGELTMKRRRKRESI